MKIMIQNLAKLEETIGYNFKDRNLLKESLTHRSYLNENPSWKVPHNERLEFLGDAVLELAVTEELFHRYPEAPEGTLTGYRSALVNYQMLAIIAKDLNLDKHVLLSRGEAKDIGRAREVILANVMEALIGAVYLDSGFQAAKKIVKAFVLDHLSEVLKMGLYKDAKSLLQEQAQAQWKITPIYKVLSEKGPDHAKIFEVAVYFGDKLIASGTGPSKQEAEVEAAKKALENL